MEPIDMKATFLGMMRVGRSVEQILNDINDAEKEKPLHPKTIPETLQILEEARREYIEAT